MVEYKEDYIEIKGVNLHYYRAGSGDTKIILLHGASDNAMCWKPTTDILAGEHEVIMPDAQGHGLSDRLGPDFKFLNQAHHVAGLAKALGIEKPVLMGHSMGGSAATNTAALYPDLPGAIILEDPGWMTPDNTRTDQGPRAKEMKERAERFRTMSIEELIEQCHEESPLWSNDELVPWAHSKKQFDASLFTQISINEMPWTEAVPKIKCPALLITAESGIVSDDTVKKAMEIWTADKPLSHAKIMGAGHSIRRENFEAYCDAVTQYLRSL